MRDIDGNRRHERERLLADSEGALERVRRIADVLVGAWFEKGTDRERVAERNRRIDLVFRWLEQGDATACDELVSLQAAVKETIGPFHWALEFPEIFREDRPDPLNGHSTGGAWMDAFVGNPPFLGGRRMRGELGDAYVAWLERRFSASLNADYSAFFFRRTFDLLADHGSVGLIATNTIAQGDTRATGLQKLLSSRGRIYDATRSMKWPGDANVAVSVVHIAKGRVAQRPLTVRLDGQNVATINSRLLGQAERPDPVALLANDGLCFVGSFVLGMGFTLTPERRAELLRKDKRNAERIFPYIGGEEVNSSPTQAFDRYVINFGDMSLEQAERWPDLIRIVREEVKPERDKMRRDAHRKYWWHFGDKRPALYASLEGKARALVTSIHTKHLCFSFADSSLVFSHATIVFPLEEGRWFAALQARVHEAWAHLLSSSLEDRLRYSASDCFETFAFPAPGAMSQLDDIGERLYNVRAKYMVETNQGLTQTYNRLKDPACRDAPVFELRKLHEEMDAAVLKAYGWDDIQVPRFEEPSTDPEQRLLETFKDEVIDRLFALNAQRAVEEKLVGVQSKPSTPNDGSPRPTTSSRGTGGTKRLRRNQAARTSKKKR